CAKMDPRLRGDDKRENARDGSDGGRPDNDPDETRYGCFLPDLTGLASGPSAADLPGAISASRRRLASNESPPERPVDDCRTRPGMPIFRHAAPRRRAPLPSRP